MHNNLNVMVYQTWLLFEYHLDGIDLRRDKVIDCNLVRNKKLINFYFTRQLTEYFEFETVINITCG